MPTISVIIPCLNEEKYLGQLLDDLAAQALQPKEVIIGDCYSDDKTVRVAESYKSKLPIKIAHSKVRSPGAGRNAGAAKASGEYLLFVDADMHIPVDTIEKTDSALTQGAADFLTPGYKSDGKHMMDRLLTRLLTRLIELNIVYLHRLWGIGGVMAVRRTLHKEVGGFNPSKLTHDDMDYIKRLRKQNISFIYLSDLKCITSSRRWENHGFLHGLGRLVVENSRLGEFVIQPMLKKLGKGRKYGHYK